MKLLTKKCLYIVKHYDFLIADLIAFALGLYVSYIFRRSLEISLYNQWRLGTYGLVAVSSFLLVELLTENLKGIIARGLVKEIQVVFIQMTMTWAVCLSVLFFLHNIYFLSRIFAIASYLICFVFLLLFRNIWKVISKFSKASNSVMPKMLVVCDASRAQVVLDRLVPGSLSKLYEICGIVINEDGKIEYNDWYPHEIGLNKIDQFIGQRRVQYAYVELSNPKEENDVISRLLDAGVTVYRSLGDSVLEYADQSIEQLDGRSVIVISGAQTSLASKADRILRDIRRKISNSRNKD